MRMLILAAGVAAMAACGQQAAQENGDARQYAPIPAPVPAEIARRITAEQNGETIAVSLGERIAVALVGVPTAGYLWAVVAQPEFLETAGETGGPTNEAQLEPGFAGGSHWEVFFFDVRLPGDGVLRFEQRRPWEDETEPPAGEFWVRLVASGQE
jgi:predicted secreted protein